MLAEPVDAPVEAERIVFRRAFRDVLAAVMIGSGGADDVDELSTFTLRALGASDAGNA